MPVSERALIQRMNRALAKSDEKILKTRLDKWESQITDLGRYHKIDVSRNQLLQTYRTLEELGAYARELGVLHEIEELAD